VKPVPRHLLAVIMLLLGFSLCARACPGVTQGADSVRIRPGTDSLRVRHGEDSVRITRGADSAGWRSDTLRHAALPRKSPGMAMLLSAVVPGAGQFYNQSYWKVPIVFGLGLYFASTWLDQNRRTEIYRQKYAADLAVPLPTDIFASLAAQGQRNTDLNEREFYKEQRDTFAWYFVILYLVNVADAYVDASLFDFDVGGDLSLRVLPGAAGPLNPVPGVTLRIGF